MGPAMIADQFLGVVRAETTESQTKKEIGMA